MQSMVYLWNNRILKDIYVYALCANKYPRKRLFSDMWISYSERHKIQLVVNFILVSLLWSRKLCNQEIMVIYCETGLLIWSSNELITCTSFLLNTFIEKNINLGEVMATILNQLSVVFLLKNLICLYINPFL